MNIVLNNDKIQEVVIGGTGPQGPQGPLGNLSSSPDLDVTTLQDGSLLVYKSSTQKWTSSTLLNSQTLDGGFF